MVAKFDNPAGVTQDAVDLSEMEQRRQEVKEIIQELLRTDATLKQMIADAVDDAPNPPTPRAG